MEPATTDSADAAGGASLGVSVNFDGTSSTQSAESQDASMDVDELRAKPIFGKGLSIKLKPADGEKSYEVAPGLTRVHSNISNRSQESCRSVRKADSANSVGPNAVERIKPPKPEKSKTTSFSMTEKKKAKKKGSDEFEDEDDGDEENFAAGGLRKSVKKVCSTKSTKEKGEDGNDSGLLVAPVVSNCGGGSTNLNKAKKSNTLKVLGQADGEDGTNADRPKRGSFLASDNDLQSKLKDRFGDQGLTLLKPGEGENGGGEKRRVSIMEDDSMKWSQQRRQSTKSQGDRNMFGRMNTIQSMASSMEIEEQAVLANGMMTKKKSRMTKVFISFKYHLWLFLEEPFASKTSSLLSYGMVLVIFTSLCLAMHFSFAEALWENSDNITDVPWSRWVTSGINVLFTVEVFLRLWSIPQRSLFLYQPLNVVDILAVVPFWLNAVVGLHLIWDGFGLISVFEAFLKLLKVCRYFWGWHLLFIALRDSTAALVIPLFFLFLLVMCGSCVLLWLEKDQDVANIHTLPRAFHFLIVCVISIGTGPVHDMEPATDFGKIVTAILMGFGVMFMAMPISIVGTSFAQTWFDKDRIILLHKVRSRIAQKGYDVSNLQEVFDDVDADGSGMVEFEEFRMMLETFSLGLNVAKMRRLFQYFDADMDGAISYTDFVCALYPEIAVDAEAVEEEDFDEDESDEYTESEEDSEDDSEEEDDDEEGTTSSNNLQTVLNGNTKAGNYGKAGSADSIIKVHGPGKDVEDPQSLGGTKPKEPPNAVKRGSILKDPNRERSSVVSVDTISGFFQGGPAASSSGGDANSSAEGRSSAHSARSSLTAGNTQNGMSMMTKVASIVKGGGRSSIQKQGNGITSAFSNIFGSGQNKAPESAMLAKEPKANYHSRESVAKVKSDEGCSSIDSKASKQSDRSEKSDKSRGKDKNKGFMGMGKMLSDAAQNRSNPRPFTPFGPSNSTGKNEPMAMGKMTSDAGLAMTKKVSSSAAASKIVAGRPPHLQQQSVAGHEKIHNSAQGDHAKALPRTIESACEMLEHLVVAVPHLQKTMDQVLHVMAQPSAPRSFGQSNNAAALPWQQAQPKVALRKNGTGSQGLARKPKDPKGESRGKTTSPRSSEKSRHSLSSNRHSLSSNRHSLVSGQGASNRHSLSSNRHSLVSGQSAREHGMRHVQSDMGSFMSGIGSSPDPSAHSSSSNSKRKIKTNSMRRFEDTPEEHDNFLEKGADLQQDESTSSAPLCEVHHGEEYQDVHNEVASRWVRHSLGGVPSIPLGKQPGGFAAPAAPPRRITERDDEDSSRPLTGEDVGRRPPRRITERDDEDSSRPLTGEDVGSLLSQLPSQYPAPEAFDDVMGVPTSDDFEGVDNSALEDRSQDDKTSGGNGRCDPEVRSI